VGELGMFWAVLNEPPVSSIRYVATLDTAT
jgi:hypothetical protein